MNEFLEGMKVPHKMLLDRESLPEITMMGVAGCWAALSLYLAAFIGLTVMLVVAMP
jgi:hypothetical protein